MALQDTFQTAKETSFQQRMVIAVLEVVKTVNTEGSGVTNHAERLALADLAGPQLDRAQAFSLQVAPALLVYTSADKDSTDAELETALTGIWTALADIYIRQGVIADPTP